ncbi:MAG TPA: hypothetical protein VIH99_11250 [Bdellovibrionota bacterium]|jgi:hypothetical protein
MNFWNFAVLGTSFLAPIAGVLFFILKRERSQELEIKACLLIFGAAMAAAVAGIVHFNSPVKMEFLWPLTLEQSGYFEFSLQLFWSRFVWVFFMAAMFLAHMAYDGISFPREGHRKPGLLLVGSFAFALLAFLCENILLSLMFVEFSAFLLHAFGMEGEEGEIERASYFKRTCFVFLALVAVLGIALSREFSSSSVMLLGSVLYLFAVLVSRHTLTGWPQLPLLLVHIGMPLFLIERLMIGASSPELWAPLSAVFGLGVVVSAALCLLTPGMLGTAFWMAFSFLAYLLFLRFSSSKPGDPFWGGYEAVGLGAVYAIGVLFRFGDRLDLFWKRATAFGLVALFLGFVVGALPTVEMPATRFDSETTLIKIALLGFFTFMISAVSARGLMLSLEEKSKSASSRNTLARLAPSLVLLAAQTGALLKWHDLNFDDVAASGITGHLYDSRVLVTAAALLVGFLAGGLLGTNTGFVKWTKNRGRSMEDFFPVIDPAIVRRGLQAAQVSEQGIEWFSSRVRATGERAAGSLDETDRAVFGDKLFRGFSEYGSALSQITRFFQSGQTRAYLFLGALVTILSSLIFLLEGR